MKPSLFQRVIPLLFLGSVCVAGDLPELAKNTTGQPAPVPGEFDSLGNVALERLGKKQENASTEDKEKGKGTPPGTEDGKQGTDKAVRDADGKTAKDYFTAGALRHKMGDRDGAAAAYTRAIEMDPNYAAAYYNRACVWLAKKNYDNLISDTTKALDLGYESKANLLCLRGTGWAGKGDFEKAVTDHNAAITIDPSYALAYNNRGNDYYRKGEVAKAIKDCEKSIELDPSSPLPWYNRGYAYYTLKKYPKAVADWKRAIELQPEYAAELEPLIGKVEGR
ncbi:MAG TPA: tetratricopeptide repeat protein [Verrucomicrobiales bacterium]|nr:tetratricopeptide repeat protein [Verrucomicrobiales bacterium]